MEFHPIAMIFEQDWSLKYPYFAHGQAIHWEEGVGDYVSASGDVVTPSGFQPGEEQFNNPFPAYEFQWSLSEVINAILDAGLQLKTLREYPYSNGAMLFEGMQAQPDRRVYTPEDLPSLPLMIGLVAAK